MVSTIATLPQSAYAFSWPCIDKTEGKAPMAISDNDLYVTWWGNGTGNFEVMFKASNDNGQTFGDKINLSSSTNGTSVGADVAASGDNVYVTYWDNKTGTGKVYLRASTDNGQTFGEPINLSNSTGIQSTREEIEASEDNVYVSWWDTSDGKDQPMMRASNDGGETFGAVIMLAANSTLSS